MDHNFKASASLLQENEMNPTEKLYFTMAVMDSKMQTLRMNISYIKKDNELCEKEIAEEESAISKIDVEIETFSRREQACIARIDNHRQTMVLLQNMETSMKHKLITLRNKKEEHKNMYKNMLKEYNNTAEEYHEIYIQIPCIKEKTYYNVEIMKKNIEVERLKKEYNDYIQKLNFFESINEQRMRVGMITLAKAIVKRNDQKRIYETNLQYRENALQSIETLKNRKQELASKLAEKAKNAVAKIRERTGDIQRRVSMKDFGTEAPRTIKSVASIKERLGLTSFASFQNILFNKFEPVQTTQLVKPNSHQVNEDTSVINIGNQQQEEDQPKINIGEQTKISNEPNHGVSDKVYQPDVTQTRLGPDKVGLKEHTNKIDMQLKSFNNSKETNKQNIKLPSEPQPSKNSPSPPKIVKPSTIEYKKKVIKTLPVIAKKKTKLIKKPIKRINQPINKIENRKRVRKVSFNPSIKISKLPRIEKNTQEITKSPSEYEKSQQKENPVNVQTVAAQSPNKVGQKAPSMLNLSPEGSDSSTSLNLPRFGSPELTIDNDKHEEPSTPQMGNFLASPPFSMQQSHNVPSDLNFFGTSRLGKMEPSSLFKLF